MGTGGESSLVQWNRGEGAVQEPVRGRDEWRVVDALPHAILVLLPDGRIRMANRAWWVATGKEIPPDSDGNAWLEAVAEADRSHVAQCVQRLLQDGVLFESEIRLLKSDDLTEHWFLLRTGVLDRELGAQAKWILTFTEIEGLHRTLEYSRGELDEFCYSVSHDLRTPLRAIDGFTKAILDDDGEFLSESGKGALGRVRAAAARMDGLITSLLTLARVSRSEIGLVEVDLSQRVRSLAEHARNPSLTLVVTDGLKAKCDSRLIDLLLTNLLDNALKFTESVEQPRIEFGEAARTDGTRAFFLRDNGIGFDPQFADRLFKPFERLHGNGFAGNGIGLAIVQKIVTKHGGRAWADGAEGAGATFWFVLPA